MVKSERGIKLHGKEHEVMCWMRKNMVMDTGMNSKAYEKDCDAW